MIFCASHGQAPRRADTFVYKPSANAKVSSHFAPWKKKNDARIHIEAGEFDILFIYVSFIDDLI